MLLWTLLRTNKNWIIPVLAVLILFVYGELKVNEGEEKALIKVERKTQESQKEINRAKAHLDSVGIDTAERLRSGAF